MSKRIISTIIYILISVLLISCKSEVTSKITNDENETVVLDDNINITKQDITSKEEKDDDTIIFAEKLVSCENIQDMISAIYAYLGGAWTLAEYINLVWYPTGEENDDELRSNYEEGYIEYLGQDFIFNEESVLIPAYVDGINIYNRSNDYIYKFSTNKELRAPIVEVYGEIVDEDNESVRFIFDGNGETYLEYKHYFFRLEKNN